MAHFKEEHRQQHDREPDARQDARVVPLGSRPRGNPPIDREELERGREKLARVLGH